MSPDEAQQRIEQQADPALNQTEDFRALAHRHEGIREEAKSALLLNQEAKAASELLADAPQLGLEHKALVERFLKEFPPAISEASFGNFMVWKHAYPRQIAMVEGHIVLGFEKGGKATMLQPFGPEPARIIEAISDRGPVKWHRVDERIALQVANDQVGLDVYADPEEADFVYRKADLIEMQGSAYAKLRGHARAAEKLDLQIVPLRDELVSDCLQVNSRWLASKGERLTDIHVRDAEAAEAMLRGLEHFNLHGIVIYADEQPVSFVVGEHLAPGVIASSFEKADLGMRGLAVFAFREWAKSLPEEVQHVNRMQAQGDPGLTSWKRSWNPDHMVHKYVLNK